MMKFKLRRSGRSKKRYLNYDIEFRKPKKPSYLGGNKDFNKKIELVRRINQSLYFEEIYEINKMPENKLTLEDKAKIRKKFENIIKDNSVVN